MIGQKVAAARGSYRDAYATADIIVLTLAEERYTSCMFSENRDMKLLIRAVICDCRLLGGLTMQALATEGKFQVLT